MRHNTKKGFTLVELLVVIAILAILATVSVVGYTSFIESTNLTVDKDLATQLNHFLEAYKVNHREDITEDNIWFVTDEILELGGIEELQAQTDDYHFFYDFQEGEYIVKKDSEIAQSGWRRLVNLFTPAAGTKGNKAGLFIDDQLKEYFLVDTTGSDLALAVRGFYTLEGIAGDTVAEQFGNFLAAIDNAGDFADELQALADNTVFATSAGNFVTGANTTHTNLYIHDEATYVDNKKQVVNEEGEIGNLTVLDSETPLLVVDIDTTIVVPTGVMLPSYSLNVQAKAGSGANVTIVLDANGWNDELRHTVDAEFTNESATIVVNGKQYVLKNEGYEVYTKVGDIFTTELGCNFPIYDFNGAIADVANKVVNTFVEGVRNNSGFVALDVVMGEGDDAFNGFKLLAVDANLKQTVNTPASKPLVTWTITSVTVAGTEYTGENIENYVELDGSFVKFVRGEDGLLPAIDNIKLSAYANKAWGDGEKGEYATQNFEVNIVRVTSINLNLNNQALGSLINLICQNGNETKFNISGGFDDNGNQLTIDQSIHYNYSQFEAADSGITLDHQLVLEFICEHTNHTIECCGHIHDESCDMECQHKITHTPTSECLDCAHECADWGYYCCNHNHTDDCRKGVCTHIPGGTHAAECLKCTHNHNDACYKTKCAHTIYGSHTAECGSCTHTKHNDNCCKYGGTGLLHWGHSKSCCEHAHDSTCYTTCGHEHKDEDCLTCTHTTHDDTCYAELCKHPHTEACINLSKCNHVSTSNHTTGDKCCTHKCTDVIPDGYTGPGLIAGNQYQCLECTHTCLNSDECDECDHVHHLKDRCACFTDADGNNVCDVCKAEICTIPGCTATHCDEKCMHWAHKAEAAYDSENQIWQIVGDGECAGKVKVVVGGQYTITFDNVNIYNSFELTAKNNLNTLGSIASTAAGVMTKVEDKDVINLISGNTIKVEDLFDGDIPEDAIIMIFGERNEDDDYMNVSRAVLPLYSDALALGAKVWTADNRIERDVNGVWEEIQLYGTRDESVYIAVLIDAVFDEYGALVSAKRISEDVTVNVVPGKNVRNYSELSTTESNILLDDIRIPSTSDVAKRFVQAANTTFYGNCYTFDITNGITQGYYGVITLGNANMQDTRVVGLLYDGIGMEGDKPWGTNAVWAYGVSTLTNCYISNTRAPLCAGKSSSDVTVDKITLNNCVLFGGKYANIDVKNGTLILKGKVVTINQPHTDEYNVDTVGLGDRDCGLAIVVWVQAKEGTNIQGVENVVQYNFISEDYNNLPVVNIGNDTISLTIDTSNMINEFFGNKDKFGDYYFTRSDSRYLNASIVCLDAGWAADIEQLASYALQNGDRSGFNKTSFGSYKYVQYTEGVWILIVPYDLYLHCYGLIAGGEAEEAMFTASENAEFIFSPWAHSVKTGVDAENNDIYTVYEAYDFVDGNIIPANLR